MVVVFYHQKIDVFPIPNWLFSYQEWLIYHHLKLLFFTIRKCVFNIQNIQNGRLTIWKLLFYHQKMLFSYQELLFYHQQVFFPLSKLLCSYQKNAGYRQTSLFYHLKKLVSKHGWFRIHVFLSPKKRELYNHCGFSINNSAYEGPSTSHTSPP